MGGGARARIAAGGDRVQRFLDGADMRPDDAVDAVVEHLLGDPLARFAAIGRDPHERRHRRRQAGAIGDLAPVEHVLQAVAQRPDVVGAVLHLEHHTVIGGRAHRLGDADLRRGEGGEGGFARFQGPDHAVQAGCFGHCRAPSRKRDGRFAPRAGSTRGATDECSNALPRSTDYRCVFRHDTARLRSRRRPQCAVIRAARPSRAGRGRGPSSPRPGSARPPGAAPPLRDRRGSAPCRRRPGPAHPPRAGRAAGGRHR